MNVVILGSSGMVGKGILLECLDNPEVKKILIVNRKHINIDHPKLQEMIVEDFLNLEESKLNLKGFDACFFSIGTTSVGKSEEEYHKLNYDITTNFASAFLELNPNSSFCYVSAAGSDTSEKGKVMWARIRGKTENAILNMGFRSAYIFRPSYIHPMKGTKSRLKILNFLYFIFSPLYWLVLRHIPGSSTSTINIGKAMINLFVKQPELNILNSKEINKIAKDSY